MSVLDAISLVAAFAAVAWFMWYLTRPHAQRKAEDDARTFFDRHGHWPDEEPPKA
jgi:hypothetical protein